MVISTSSKIVGGLEIKVGDRLEMLGRTFVLDIDYSLAGDFAVWFDENSSMMIYATPNFEIKGVPIQIDYDSYNIAIGCYEGDIEDYEHYKQIVKNEFEKIMRAIPNSPKCECSKYNIESEQIKIEGWDFSICSYCSRIVKEEINREMNTMDMVSRIERLEKLKKEHPELIKALKMAREVSIITYVLSEDKDVEDAFLNLEELLEKN